MAWEDSVQNMKQSFPETGTGNRLCENDHSYVGTDKGTEVNLDA
ncbi:hypothetical protein RvY_15362 [Ramazzottius varieornatus]|uniref:Uncharacterized protein n=1 Tax=Ramazzottius varieornatus TaxID=947166 RepID=A0A1D1W1H5_RAMVA|nr:hypothetical protein RvY_15362 [Ramazzottius varieornatus]